ncbi:hypothetical protein [Mesorhizobium australicum]
MGFLDANGNVARRVSVEEFDFAVGRKPSLSADLTLLLASR